MIIKIIKISFPAPTCTQGGHLVSFVDLGDVVVAHTWRVLRLLDRLVYHGPALRLVRKELGSQRLSLVKALRFVVRHRRYQLRSYLLPQETGALGV